jgi:hypothetical protein
MQNRFLSLILQIILQLEGIVLRVIGLILQQNIMGMQPLPLCSIRNTLANAHFKIYFK